MTALVRQLRIPCRYVSGYLFHEADSKDRSSAGATHAWVEAFLGDAGWVAFDPTKRLIGSGSGARLCRRGTDSRSVQRRCRKHAVGGGDGRAGEFTRAGGIAAGNSDSLQVAQSENRQFVRGPTAAITKSRRKIGRAHV